MLQEWKPLVRLGSVATIRFAWVRRAEGWHGPRGTCRAWPCSGRDRFPRCEREALDHFTHTKTTRPRTTNTTPTTSAESWPSTIQPGHSGRQRQLALRKVTRPLSLALEPPVGGLEGLRRVPKLTHRPCFPRPGRLPLEKSGGRCSTPEAAR